MALSNEELQLETTEYLPAREVMSGLCGGGGCPGHNATGWILQSNEAGVIGVGLNFNDVLNNNEIVDIVDDVNIEEINTLSAL